MRLKKLLHKNAINYLKLESIFGNEIVTAEHMNVLRSDIARSSALIWVAGRLRHAAARAHDATAVRGVFRLTTPPPVFTSCFPHRVYAEYRSVSLPQVAHRDIETYRVFNLVIFAHDLV